MIAQMRSGNEVMAARVTTVDAMRIVMEIPGRPIPCPRPRVSKHGTYYPKAYQEWLSAAKVLLRQACVKQNGGRLMEGDVTVVVAFTGARANADIDNLCKSVLDAAQGMVFEDDRQVVRLEAQKRKRTTVAWTAVRIEEESEDGDEAPRVCMAAMVRQRRR